MVRKIENPLPTRTETPGLPVWQKSVTVALKLATPMFGGGVELRAKDPVTPIRSGAIRSALRHWWRITEGARFTTVPELLAHESELWGSSKKPGLVSVTVSTTKPGTAVAVKSIPDDTKGSLKYAMFPFIGDNTNHPADGQENAQFELTLNCRVTSNGRDIWSEVLTALRAWLAFGGLGSRTRRGCGALTIAHPEVVRRDPAFKTLSLLPESNNKRDIEQWLQRAFSRPTVSRAWPVLGKFALIHPVGHEGVSANAAWTSAISVMRGLRQGENLGRNQGAGKFPGRSRWPEAEAIRAIKNQRLPKHQQDPNMPHQAFPRAELGMPLHFQFKDKGERGERSRDPADTCLLPVVNGRRATRMASPLVLKAMPTMTGFVPLILPLKVPGLEAVQLMSPDGMTPLSPVLQAKGHVQDPTFASYDHSPMESTKKNDTSNQGSALYALLSHALTTHGFQLVSFGEIPS